MERIRFCKPYMTGKEELYVQDVIKSNNKLSGDGFYTHKCEYWLESKLKSKKVLLTHSCTAALEMSAILIEISEGDEVILPSYTFVSTANAFVLRGAKPVFVDIRSDTLNINEELIEQNITSRTKAIVIVHYAGFACNMDKLKSLCDKYNLFLIEDAAQALLSSYKNKALGSFGDLATFSFHETKNIVCGEGGALAINNHKLVSRAEIIWEKGTNRRQFALGKVSKYSWIDIGSSFLPSELTAAFLWAQLESSEAITAERLKIWDLYFSLLKTICDQYGIKVPVRSDLCQHNAHMFFLIFDSNVKRDSFISYLDKRGITAVFHYQPLHLSSFYKSKYHIKSPPKLPITEWVYPNIVRLPLWVGLEQKLESVINTTKEAIKYIYH